VTNTPTPRAFAAALCARGIEVILRGNRLKVWPGPAFKLGLSDAERVYLREHRDELKALCPLPETTVTWHPPDPADAIRAAERDAAIAAAARDAQLKAQNLDVWLVLHGDEPEATAIRDQQATEVMRRMVGRPSPAFPLWSNL
jgi:hypothetical protein